LHPSRNILFLGSKFLLQFSHVVLNIFQLGLSHGDFVVFRLFHFFLAALTMSSLRKTFWVITVDRFFVFSRPRHVQTRTLFII